MENVVIIGSGPAGLTAALYTARANLNPIVVDGMQPGGQLTTTTEVENYPGFAEAVDGTTLVMSMREQAERFGTRFEMDEVEACDFSGTAHSVRLASGKTLEAHCVIIASGAAARYLGLESEQALIGRGVSGCATCDGAFFRDQEIAVVGGGDTAMEDALFLARLCSKVTVIHRRDAFRASKIMGDRVQTHEKIDVLWDSVVVEVLGVDKTEVTGLKVRNVKTDAMTELAVTGMFVAIGHTPNSTPFAGQLELDAEGYITTEQTRTSRPGVFACGDVQDRHYKQAVTAAGSGCMAALETERYLATL